MEAVIINQFREVSSINAGISIFKSYYYKSLQCGILMCIFKYVNLLKMMLKFRKDGCV